MRTNKLTKNEDFQNVYKFGKKYQGSWIKLFILKTPTLKSKIGIVISRKIRGSVFRNRLKRILREFFRSKTFILDQNFSIIVLVFSAKPNYGLAHVVLEMDRLFHKSGIRQE